MYVIVNDRLISWNATINDNQSVNYRHVYSALTFSVALASNTIFDARSRNRLICFANFPTKINFCAIKSDVFLFRSSPPLNLQKLFKCGGQFLYCSVTSKVTFNKCQVGIIFPKKIDYYVRTPTFVSQFIVLYFYARPE